jgi:hypothetical protein
MQYIAKIGEVAMQDIRNNCSSSSQESRGMVCIDTRRVLDSCKDRDCFEDARVYLTNYGEEVLSSAGNIRTRSAEILCAYVGVEEVPFNQGFYKVTVRYYILIEVEACVGLGKSQCIKGITAIEKDVVLYGGEGNVTSFASSPNNGYCSICTNSNSSTNAPIAVVETVEPVVRGTKVKECSCGCECECDCGEIPSDVLCCLDGEICSTGDYPRLYVSLGLFSVIRIERPTQLLVQATDYSVPDKECVTPCDENPCAIFNNMAFPTNEFCSQIPKEITSCNVKCK